MTVLLLICLPLTLIGAFVVWHIVRPQHAPADASNRLNKVRLLWFAATREAELARVIPWLQLDESQVAPIPKEPPA